MHCLLVCLLCGTIPAPVWAQLAPKTGVQTVKLVSLLVEDEIYRQTELKPLILRYADDVAKAQDAEVIITILNNDVSPFDIYEGLAQLYYNGLPADDSPADLKGVILIGDLPLPVVEKNGNLWPTVFPYTDFYEPSYLWDEEKERFVFETGQNMAPEIWHGVIKAPSDNLTTRVSQLRNFFNANHGIHRDEITFDKKVFIADLVRQRKIVPSMLYWRYQEWVEFVEEVQYLRYTKHWLRRLYERAEQAGISSGNLNSLTENEKQALADEILAADSGLTRAEVLETLNADNLSELPDNFAKSIIDNLAKRYVRLYENWITQANTHVERSGRWTAADVESLPALVSQKDEASVLALRYFNDLVEEALLEAVNEANVPQDVAMPHTVVVPYEESGPEGGTNYTNKPAYWNGVRPSGNMTAEECTLIRGSQRNDTFPFAQQVEANQSMDIDTIDLCKNVSEPNFNSDKYEGCCARNITYEDNAFGYNTCNLGTLWAGGQSGINSLYHVGTELPVFSQRGTREIVGLQGADGCRPGLAVNEDETYAARFSSLMVHDEPRPKTIMDQVSAQFTRALPVDDPRALSFMDHGEKFHRLEFPNVFTQREAVANANQLQIAMRNILQTKVDNINTITAAGNTVSNQQFSSGAGFAGQNSIWFAQYASTDTGGGAGPGLSTEPGGGTGGGGDDECTISQTVQAIDEFTKARRWSGCGGSFTKFYETGALIPNSFVDEIMAKFDWQKVYEALAWIDLNIESKNRQAFEHAMRGSEDYNDFFEETDFKGYEVVQIIGNGSTEQGLEMAFLPEDFDPDFQFLEARSEEAAFVYETGETSTEFLGEDFADTFLNAEEESKCDSIPNTTLTWPLRLACSIKATTTATTKKVAVGPNLGTNAPIEPIIEDLNVSLEGKKLTVTPGNIFASSQGRDLIEVTVKLEDTAGNLQKGDFSTEISLEFDSTDAADFFEISPAQNLPLVAGEITFFLVPKGREFGGQFNMTAVARNLNNSAKKLSSVPIPVRLGQYRLWSKIIEDELIVGDEDGTTVEVKVLDINDVPTRDWEGETLEFNSAGGTFENYGKTTIKNGIARIKFLPGTKTGTYEINVSQPETLLPPHKTKVTLLPDLAVGIQFNKKSPYLVAGSFYQNIGAQLVDKFNNIVDGVPHEWTWKTQNLDILDRAAYDADPRKNGVQMLASFGSISELPIRATAGKDTAQILILSDFLAEESTKALEFKVIQDPVFQVSFDKTKVEAGDENFITAQIEARTKDGLLIEDDFVLQIGSEPIVRGTLPENVQLFNGKGEFKFQPGTLAGNFKLRLAYPGFVNSLTAFTVLPGEPAKVDLSLPNKNPEAVDFDANETIELSVQVYDKYRNLVPNWVGKMNLRATEGTSHLIDIDTSDLNFISGKKTIALKPKNLSGTVRLLAEHEDLTLGTLEFKLTSFFKLTDVQNLAPRNLLTLLLGWEAGDLRYAQNFALTWLTKNKTGGVATLANAPEPNYQYGYVAPSGDLGPRLDQEWVSAQHFNSLIKGDNKIIAQAKRHAPLEVKDTQDLENVDAPALAWKSLIVKNKTLTYDEAEKVWRWDGLRVIELGSEGGLKLLDRNFTLKPTRNIFIWNVYRNRDLLGTFKWVYSDQKLEIKENFTQNGALEIQLIDPKVYSDESLVGNSTNAGFGYVLLDQSKKEMTSRKLGSLEASIENETGTNYLAWGPDWGAAAHVAAGESLGNAVQLSSSDLLIFYGDPSLSVKLTNGTSPKTGFTKDMGQPLFKTVDGNIKTLFSVDADADGLKDVLALTGNKLWVSRQLKPNGKDRLQFKAPEMWLQLPGGIKSSLLLEGTNENWSLLQLDYSDQLIAWAWNDGQFEPTQVTWLGNSPIESFQTGVLNEDGFTDLVVVDENHSLWRWSWLGENRFATPELIAEFPPNFVFTDESLDNPNINLKLGFISYEGIEGDGVLAGNTTMIKTSPDARKITLTPDNLDEALIGSYYDETKSNPNQVQFVSLEDASFLGRADYTTESDKEQVIPGDIIEVEFKLSTTNTLDKVQLILPQDKYFSYVPNSFSCTNCGGAVEILQKSEREIFWARIPRLQRNSVATLSWQLQVEALPNLKVAVGDFENGFDTLDDIAVAWSEGDDPIMLYYMSSKAEADNPVVKPISDQNDVVEVSDAAITSAFDNTADPDGDGIPASHDHYPDTANGAESIGAGLLPGMLAGAIGGITASLLQGGGSCFHQPMSKAQNAPGLATNYNPPHATPGGKSGGRCATCLRNLRTYNMPTSTGRSASAVCLGLKRPNMASPVETDNCHVSTATQQFNETCPESGTNPETSRMLNNSSSFVQGSMNFQIPGNIDAASLNSKLQTQSGPISGRLTAGTDKASAWSSQQFVDLNRKTAESEPGANRVDSSPSFAGESGPNHLRPEGAMDEAQNALEAGDTVNFTREPVPVVIPSTKASELKSAESEFTINKEAFETELESVIPADTENFQNSLEALVEAYPEMVTTELADLPDEELLRASFTRYQIQLRDFAAAYKAVCLENETNQVTESCKVAQSYMLQAQTDFNQLRTLQETGLASLVTARAEAEVALEELAAKEPTLAPALADYAESLETAVEARSTLEGFVQKFTESFDNTKDLITSATDRVLEIREIENQVVAATTQMTEIYAKQQEAFEAKETQKQNEWMAASAVNQAQHSAEQGVMNQFYNFSLTYQTDIVDRGTLLPWKTNNGINGDLPITTLPVFPQVKQDAKNSTPGRMDVTLPEVQVETVDLGPLKTMEEVPPMPEVSNDLAADIEQLSFEINPVEEMASLTAGLERWKALAQALETEQLFPDLNSEAVLSGNFTPLPSVPANLSVEGLKAMAALTPESLPKRLEPVVTPELPAFNTVPKVIQPPLDFAANLPQLPIDQKPFTPPPPSTLPKVPQLLAAAQPAFARMGKIGAYRIGASPVSEWDVKPHVERRTGRTSLDGNRDFTAAALDFKPYAEVAQNLNITSATGINDMFNSLGENWKNFSSSITESLSFPNTPNLPAVQTPLPTEPIEAVSLLPSQNWALLQKAAWQYRGLMPELKVWEDWVIASEPIDTVATQKWLTDYRETWNNYLVKLNDYENQLSAENRALAKLANQDKLAFWESPQVLALVPKLGRQFTADETPSLNLSIPDREFISKPLNLDLPDISVSDFDYFNVPGFDLPGNNVADLLSTGVVSNDGDGSLTDKEKEDLQNAGLKPGMYYAKSENAEVDLLHTMPFYGVEAQTGADLDGDGQNEILYTLRQRTVYLKRSPSFEPEVIKSATLKQWPQAEFLAAELPLKSFDTTPFWSQMNLDVVPYSANSNPFYEWILESKIDGAPEFIHGIFTQKEIEPETKQKTMAQVTRVTGEVEVAQLSRIDFPVRTKEVCLGLEPYQIYYDDVLIRAGNKPATLWTYLHPLRGREAQEKQWTLNPGEALRLEYADVCLTEGEASWQQTDEEDFMSRKSLLNNEALSDGSVLTLKSDSKVEVLLADGQSIDIEGPVTYYWNQILPGEVPEAQQIPSLNYYMTYNKLRTWRDGLPSITQSLPAHPSVLPWQN
ncbi:hypothetical protein GW756_04690 [bacterium]|nr:hypothetical protein [bacterium]NCQ55678.1 hypothetical protein [Candidatus Parcubacteria bacterium]NCS67627.1 hypothetical protein [Candidatus Peregrinibacteria bacterium]NCS96641.1 hypothetical protein [bacterium]